MTTKKNDNKKTKTTTKAKASSGRIEMCPVTEYKVISSGKHTLSLKPVNSDMVFFMGNLETKFEDLYKNMEETYGLSQLVNEEIYCIAFDYRVMPIGIIKIGQGKDDSTDVNNSLAFMFLNLIGAYSFLYVHNHPKDKEENNLSYQDFSDDDLLSDRYTYYLGALMGIPNMGNMIIYDGGYKFMKGEMHR